jgi:hypothetical protein
VSSSRSSRSFTYSWLKAQAGVKSLPADLFLVQGEGQRPPTSEARFGETPELAAFSDRRCYPRMSIYRVVEAIDVVADSTMPIPGFYRGTVLELGGEVPLWRAFGPYGADIVKPIDYLATLQVSDIEILATIIAGWPEMDRGERLPASFMAADAAVWSGYRTPLAANTLDGFGQPLYGLKEALFKSACKVILRIVAQANRADLVESTKPYINVTLEPIARFAAAAGWAAGAREQWPHRVEIIARPWRELSVGLVETYLDIRDAPAPVVNTPLALPSPKQSLDQASQDD